MRVYKSLPLWECGLKYGEGCINEDVFEVTPLVGVWIEIELEDEY